MTTRTWVGGHTGDPTSWDEALNWSGATAPVSSDTVIIPAVTSQPTLVSNTPVLNVVTINAGASLTLGSFSLNVNNSVLGGVAIKLLGSGSTLNIASGNINAPTDSLSLASGSILSGFGSVNAKSYTGLGHITATGGQLILTGNVASGIIMTIGAGSASNLTLLGTDISSSAIAINGANQTLEIGGDLKITPAESITNGTIKIDGASLTDTAGISLGAGSTLVGNGTVASSTSGLSGSGVVEASGGILELEQSVGSTNLNFKIDDTLASDEVASTLQLDGSVGSGNAFTFLGATGDLALQTATTFNDTIVGLNVGSDQTPTNTNFLDLSAEPGVTVTSGSTGSGANGIVTLSDGDTLHLSGITGSSGNWTVNSTTDGSAGTDIFLSTVCFAAGTRILTAAGERVVESLMQDNIVLALVGDELSAQSIKWIGQRRISLTSHPNSEMAAPVRIERGAIADDVPHRDLLVSPDHAIFIDGMLICSRQLINGTTIRQEKDWRMVEYFHIELETHAILLAEGLAVESYLNTGNQGFFANADAPLVLHPDLTDRRDCPTRETASCAPFVRDEGSVGPIWKRFADRAIALGRLLPQSNATIDPELRLVANDRTLRPVSNDDGRYCFLLPPGTTEVRLVSHAGPPADACPWLDDRRRLGVPVGRMMLRDASQAYDLPLDNPNLSEGWWVVERDGIAMRRWTDGEAVLPLPTFPSSGPALLEIHLVGKMIYINAAGPEASTSVMAA